MGSRGNKKSDYAAKSAQDLPFVKVSINYTDSKHISQYSLSTWQHDWNGAISNKLHSVKLVMAVLLEVVHGRKEGRKYFI